MSEGVITQGMGGGKQNHPKNLLSQSVNPKSKDQGQKPTQRSDLTLIWWDKHSNVCMNFVKVKTKNYSGPISP